MSSSYDPTPPSYNYQPLKDDGPLSKSFQDAGKAIGNVLGTAIAKADGMSGFALSLAGKVGSLAGMFAGHEIGLYADNAETITNNINAAMQEANDPDSWQLAQPMNDDW